MTDAKPSLQKTASHSKDHWSKLNTSIKGRLSKVVGDDDDFYAVKHDTECVIAVKEFADKPSHQYDLKRLIEHSQAYEDHPEVERRGGLSTYEDELRNRLSTAVFVGHINTDLDSVAGAIGAAALFGGTPAISEPPESLNGEIQFALKHCNIQTPQQFDKITDIDTKDVCLVDHTEEKQMVESLRSCQNRETRIIGVVDHHALAKSFYTSKPIFMDVRPWGSMCTIVSYLFMSYRRSLPKPMALLMLQAILSDTLNLRSVTATDADRSMVALLSVYSGVSNVPPAVVDTEEETKEGEEKEDETSKQGMYVETEIDLLAKQQFQAKTDWVVSLGAYEMVRGDQKDFTCGPWKFGISVLEVTNVDSVMKIAGDILFELRLLKKEKGLVKRGDKDALSEDAMEDYLASIYEEEELATVEEELNMNQLTELRLERSRELDFAFLFVVNIVEETSILLIAGGRELALAKAAFLEDETVQAKGEVIVQEAYPGIQAPGSTIRSDETAMLLPKGYVSRKAQFVPAFFSAIQRDFVYEGKGPMSGGGDDLDQFAEVKRSVDVMQALEISKKGGASASRIPKRGKKMKRQSSLRGAALSSLVKCEKDLESTLAKETEMAYENHDGNYYDDNGRIFRAYNSIVGVYKSMFQAKQSVQIES